MLSEEEIIREAVRLALRKEETVVSGDNSTSSATAGTETAEQVAKTLTTSSSKTKAAIPSKQKTGSSSRTGNGGAGRKRKRAPEGLDSNWKTLQKSLGKCVSKRAKRPRRTDATKSARAGDDGDVENGGKKGNEDAVTLSAFVKRRVTKTEEVSRVVAVDCEMVGVGPEGKENALARVSIVNYCGDVLYDKFVKVKEHVSDYRTKWSGIRPEDIAQDAEGVVDLWEAQQKVGELIKGRVVVGHALGNDFAAMRLKHPRRDMRDTAEFYKRIWKGGRRGGRPPALRVVVVKVLGVEGFQGGEHDSCEDARAALMLYKKNRVEWEKWIRERREKGKGKGKGKGKKGD